MSAVYKFLNSLDGKFDKAIGVPVRFEVWDFNKPPMREGIILSVSKESRKFSRVMFGKVIKQNVFNLTVLDSSGTKVSFSIAKGRILGATNFMKCYFV